MKKRVRLWLGMLAVVGACLGVGNYRYADAHVSEVDNDVVCGQNEDSFVCANSNELSPALIDNLKELDNALQGKGELKADLFSANNDSDDIKNSNTQQKIFLHDGLMPSMGNVHAKIIRIEFSDVKFSDEISEEYLEDMMFGEQDIESYKFPKESVNAWYQRSSYGKLSLWGEAETITLDNTKDYYTYDEEDNIDGEVKFIEEVWDKINAKNIDWSEYDINNDKYIDACCLMVAGSSGEWSGQWWSQVLCDNTYSFGDGYYMGQYMRCGEEHLKNPSTIIHEMGHCMGLPDLYDLAETAKYGAFGNGGLRATDMMDQNTGEINAFCKMLLGWIDADNIHVVPHGSDLTSVSLESYAKTGDCAVLFLNEGDKSLFSEYYLVQYQDFALNNEELEWMMEKEYLRIYHVNAELTDDKYSFMHDNSSYDEDCNLIQAVDCDVEKMHGKNSISNYGMSTVYSTSPFYGASPACGFYMGDEFTPYTAPGTGKYAKDRQRHSLELFSGLNVKNIIVNEDGASFDVFYEDEPSEASDLILTPARSMSNYWISTSLMLIANHDIWLDDNAEKPYMRVKGQTEKILNYSVEMKEPKMDGETTCFGEYGEHYLTRITPEGNCDIEDNTEYEIVFPAGLFITSYGETSKEIVISGKTRIEVWRGHNTTWVDKSIEELKDVETFSQSEVVENGKITYAGVKNDNSLHLYEIDIKTCELVSSEQLLSNTGDYKERYLREIGRTDNGVYYVGLYGTDINGNYIKKVYLFDSNKTLIKEIEGYDVSNSNGNLIYLDKGDDECVLDTTTFEIVSFSPSEYYFGIIELVHRYGENYLIGENTSKSRNNWIYNIRDKEDNILKVINFNGVNVTDILDYGEGYLLFGRDGTKAVVLYANDELKIEKSVILAENIDIRYEVEAMVISDEGYLVHWYENGESIYALFNKNFVHYTNLSFSLDRRTCFYMDNKLHLVNSRGDSFGLRHIYSNAIDMPDTSNGIEGIQISDDVITKDGYIIYGDVSKLEEYAASIQPVDKEKYDIFEFDGMYYLKVSDDDIKGAVYVPMKQCLHDNQVTTISKLEPTCTERGHSEEVVCTDCDTILKESTEIKELGHTPVTDAAVAPSCTATGLTEGSHCGVCNEVLVAQETVAATGHGWNNGEVTTAPTCTTAGEKTYTCGICGATKKEEVSELDHAYSDEWTTDKEPSCTEKGSKSHHCTREGCKEKADVTEVASLGHTPVTDAAVAPTCTATGLTEGSHCDVCKEVLVAQETVAATGHGWNSGEVTTAPTCTTAGEKTYTCGTCGGTKKEEVPALEHAYSDEWTTDKEPGCTEKGSKSHHCTREGCNAKEDVTEIEKAEHTPVTDAAVAPTCTQTGLTEGSHCDICNEVLVAQETVAATGHGWNNGEVTTAPTCTTAGEKTYTCGICGAIKKEEVSALDHAYSDEWTTDKEPSCTEKGSKSHHCTREGCKEKADVTEVASLGHTPVIDVAIAPTCTETGLTEGSHCDICNEVLVAQEPVAAAGHGWNNGEVTTESTCTTAGEKTYTCGICGATKKEEVSALDHAYSDEWTTDKEPGCTEKGSKSHHCTREGCKEKADVTEVAALGHTPVTDAAVAPTCTATGFTEGSHCDVCKEVLVVQETVPVKGHIWDNGKITLAATYTTTGTMEYTCSDCGEKKIETLPVLGYETYSITYELDGGEAARDIVTSYNIFTETFELAKPTKHGYTFEGWYKDSSFTQPVTAIEKGSTGNLVLYAKWQEVSVEKATIKLKNKAKRKIELSIKKGKNAVGYEVVYGNKKSLKSKTKKLTLKSTKKVIKGKKNKVYYFKVRIFTYDSTGNKVYGKWSTVKKVKVKK